MFALACSRGNFAVQVLNCFKEEEKRAMAASKSLCMCLSANQCPSLLLSSIKTPPSVRRAVSWKGSLQNAWHVTPCPISSLSMCHNCTSKYQPLHLPPAPSATRTCLWLTRTCKACSMLKPCLRDFNDGTKHLSAKQWSIVEQNSLMQFKVQHLQHRSPIGLSTCGHPS